MAKRPALPALLRELRNRLGLSQERLATTLKVSLPTINRWETGKTAPDGLALHAIEQFLRKLGPDYRDLYNSLIGQEEQARLPLETPTAPPPVPMGRRRRRAASRYVGERQENGPLDTKAMENLLWKAACSIRGEKDAPKFKDYILPLVFIKRLSDVLDDEIAGLVEKFGSEENTRDIIEADHSLVRFYIPPEATWAVVSGRRKFDWPEGKRPKTLGEQLTTTIRAISRANPSLQGVIDIVDYNETRNGEREISDEALSRLIELLTTHGIAWV